MVIPRKNYFDKFLRFTFLSRLFPPADMKQVFKWFHCTKTFKNFNCFNCMEHARKLLKTYAISSDYCYFPSISPMAGTPAL